MFNPPNVPSLVFSSIYSSAHLSITQLPLTLPHISYMSIYLPTYPSNRGPGSSVGLATGYGLDGPGIESRWGRDFSHTFRPAPGAHPASCTMGTGSCPGVKRPGRGADHPPLLAPRSNMSSAIPLLPLWALCGLL
jgi:hypothetical protein